MVVMQMLYLLLWPGSNYLEDLLGDVPLATVRPFEGCGCNMMVLHLTMPFRSVRFIFVVSPLHRKFAEALDLFLSSLPSIEKSPVEKRWIYFHRLSLHRKITGRGIDLLLTPFVEKTKSVEFIFIVSPFHRKIAGRGIDLLLTPFIEKKLSRIQGPKKIARGHWGPNAPIQDTISNF
ncbi:hypothetical protein NQ317_007121 [Molorchus minor]|uniref:Uncharacterized protein n=1 Tax=Molorchus minor TaxID=1323400 RepID=A0ABQ9JZN6_9CUCU|nr:hypothetical protein NQ317_007121 [Molorchus minor]